MVSGYWKNSAWVALPNPYGIYATSARSLIVSGSDVYVGGVCANSPNGKAYAAGYWKNGNWVSFGPDADDSSLAVSGSDVYAGGQSEDSSGVTVAGYWTNGKWEPLPNPYGVHDGFVSTLMLVTSSAVESGPITIRGFDARQDKLPNGGVRIKFTVRVEFSGAPLTYDYHWERSDGAKSRVTTASVKEGTTSEVISTAWDQGPKTQLKEVWEQLSIDVKDSHLSSERIKVSLSQ
jgi:hypothetical protein